MFLKIRRRDTAHERGGMSIALLLTAWYTSISLLVVAAATGLLYLALADNLREISEQMLTDEVDVCRALVYQRGGDSHALHEEVEIDSAVRRYERFYVRVLDGNGSALSTTPDMDEILSFHRVAEEAASHPGIFMIQSPTGASYRAIQSTVTAGPQRKQKWTLQVAVDLTQERTVLERERKWVWALLATALFFCPAIGYVIAHRNTRPLREVAGIARRIGSSTLNERIRSEGYPLEVRVLVTAFNAMLERLEDSFARLSRFSADIAHELRTPVNNIRGETEVALARSRKPEEYVEVLGSCLEESVRLSELIDSLLFLARSASPGDHLNRTQEELGKLLAGLRDYYEVSALDVGVTLSVIAADELLNVNVDRVLLQRALGNLVANSQAHCSAGGNIWLSAKRQGGYVCIEVQDNGSGIAPSALPRVFDRLYRADPARSRDLGGTGLGLAIVRQIVELHGGDVHISSEVGKGTTVSVRLPFPVPASTGA